MLNNVAMIEWDGLKRLRQLHDGQGDPIETYGLSRKEKHGRWDRGEEGGVESFITREVLFYKQKEQKHSQGQTGVCSGEGKM